MKLLHTADLHLDRSFEGLKTISEPIAERLRQANQKTIAAIVDIAIKNQVDLVIFAGDTFHQSRTSICTQAYFIEEMRRLEQADIPVIMTFGNHDYYSAEKYWFDFPKNMLLFQKEAVETQYLLTKNQEKVAISGFSYEHPWINKNLLPEFPVKDRMRDIHIGIYHGDTATKGQQSFAPFSFSEMKSKGYDYWALGHIHQPQVVSTEPVIIYPGTPQGHTKKERRVQGVAITTFDELGHGRVHFEPVAAINWQIENYSLKETNNLQEALSLLITQVLDNQDWQSSLILKEIRLTDVEQLGEELQISYENGELLAYLQEEVLQQTNQSLFIFQLELLIEDENKKVNIAADPELLQQLKDNYLQPEIFLDTLKELLQNPLFSAVVKVDDDWRRQCIEQAAQRIGEDFVIQEDRL